jgi:hypothetical protein
LHTIKLLVLTLLLQVPRSPIMCTTRMASSQIDVLPVHLGSLVREVGQRKSLEVGCNSIELLGSQGICCNWLNLSPMIVGRAGQRDVGYVFLGYHVDFYRLPSPSCRFCGRYIGDKLSLMSRLVPLLAAHLPSTRAREISWYINRRTLTRDRHRRTQSI